MQVTCEGCEDQRCTEMTQGHIKMQALVLAVLNLEFYNQCYFREFRVGTVKL